MQSWPSDPGGALAVFAVDAWQPGRAQGVLYCPALGRADPVADYGALLWALEGACDALGVPSHRDEGASACVAPPPCADRAAEFSAFPDLRPGRRATFCLWVHYRQHASCQGFVRAQGGRRAPFRSALELMRLLEAALAAPTG